MRSIGVTTRQYKPAFNMTIRDGNNQTYTITDYDVQADSLAIRTGTSNTGELTLGAAIIGSLSVTLVNDGKNNHKYNNVVWRGANIEATFTVHGTNVYLGKYYVNDHSEQGGTIHVVAYDAMQILDSYQIYEHQFTYPLDAVTAVNTIATARGLRVAGLTGVSLSLPDPGTDKMSERAFLSYVAQILCKYVVIKRMNGYDTIYFGWYDTAHPVYDAGTTFSHDLKTSDYNPENFQIKVYDKNYTVTVRGTQGQLTNLVTIEGNPFVTSENVGTPEPGGGIAYDMYTKVHALTYRPGSADIVTDIALEAGDVIRVNTGPLGGTYTMIITNLTFGTGLTMSISSDADPADDMIFNPSTYFKKATQQAIAEELGDEDSDLSKAIGGGSTEPGEIIILPAVEVNVFNKDNTAIPFGQYDGFEYRWYTPFSSGDSPFSSPYQMEAITRTGEYGLDIVSVTYPEQRVRIPTGIGETAYVDLLITRIKTPTGAEYRAAGYSSSDISERDVPFYPFPSNPHKIRCRVTRANEYVIFEPYVVNKYDSNILLSDSLNGLKRPLLWFSGFGHVPMQTADLTSQPAECYAIPSCGIPLPGMYYDLMPPATPAHELTGHKWFYLSNDGQGHQIINVIPFYDPEDPTQDYYIKYLTE